MTYKRFRVALFIAILFVSLTGSAFAQKIIADYGGHAGFQSASWVGRDLKIFEKHGLDVEIIMITGAARSVAALLGGSTQLPL
jgi:ABC-type nitrate/sulfonate/bicarbonate transport system substrate-binding protein